MKSRLSGLALLVASLAAGAAPVDPWTSAPALPTACYSGQDKFFEQATTQIERIQAARYRQEAINQDINDRLKAIDPMERSNRMVQYMLDHPEDAQKVMAAMQSQGQSFNDTALAESEEEIRQKQALNALVARYDAALKTATRPHYDKMAALPLCDGECASPPWAIEAAKAQYREIDQEYLKLCSQWWKTAPFHSWFAGYRKFLVGQISLAEEMAASVRANHKMMGVTGDYRSVTPLQGVEDYTKLARDIFSKRDPDATYDHVQW